MAKKQVPIREIAWYRSGDKGDICNVGLMAKGEKQYEALKREVTPELIKACYKDWLKGSVTIYNMDNLQAIEIVMLGALGGGATKTLRVDQTGKAMCVGLSRMMIEVDESELG
ncbi:MAG: hypothetical protein U9N44_04585 [Chloroflexota bacterium]|nr:hypothetical protein [Chloroflexota bacterium]